MSDSSSPIRLLGISGSLRAGSYNSAILAALRGLVSAPASLDVFPLNDVPLYNQDVEDAGAPDAVRQLRAAVSRSHGIVLASPEYNHGVSGVLKNALDWLSRPQGKSVLTDKPVLTMTASPGILGGVRAHAQLSETLTSIAARVVLRPQIVFTSVKGKLQDGVLTDPASLEHLAGGLKDLLAEIRSRASVTIEQN